MRKPIKTLILTTGASLLLSSNVFAAGFQVWQQSGIAVGDNAAGAAADISNVNTAYYNPAAINYFKGQMAAFSFIGQSENLKFKGSTTLSPAVADFTNNSGTTQGGDFHALPSIMYAAPINKKWAFGLSLSSPFNLELRYPKTSFVRYAVTQNEIQTYDIGPSVAYKPMKDLSFGLGFDAMYAKFVYDQTDTTTTTANDSLSKTVMAGWGHGWHAGMLWRASDKTNVGLSYRSQIHLGLKGASRFHGPLGTDKSRAKISATLPPMTIFSIQQILSPKWQVMGSAVYTQWSTLKRVRITNVANPGNNTNIDMVDGLKDAWQFILGAHYTLNPRFTFMGALSFDQTPTQKKSRQVSMPDSNAWITSLGVTYHASQTFSMDFGYSHYFFNKARINNADTFGRETVTSVGNVYRNINAFGLELDWKMT